MYVPIGISVTCETAFHPSAVIGTKSFTEAEERTIVDTAEDAWSCVGHGARQSKGPISITKRTVQDPFIARVKIVGSSSAGRIVTSCTPCYSRS